MRFIVCRPPEGEEETVSETERQRSEEIKDSRRRISGLIFQSDIVSTVGHPCGRQSGGEIAHIGVAISAAHIAIDDVETCAVVVGRSVAVLLGGEITVVVEKRGFGPDEVAHADVVEIDDIIGKSTNAVAVVEEIIEGSVEGSAESESENCFTERHPYGTAVGTIVGRGHGAGRPHRIVERTGRGHGTIMTVVLGGTGNPYGVMSEVISAMISTVITGTAVEVAVVITAIVAIMVATAVSGTTVEIAVVAVVVTTVNYSAVGAV